MRNACIAHETDRFTELITKLLHPHSFYAHPAHNGRNLKCSTTKLFWIVNINTYCRNSYTYYIYVFWFKQITQKSVI
jgi:hypothetical protein